MGISLVLHVLANAGLIWALSRYMPYDPTTASGIVASGTWQLYLIAGLILGLLNGIIKPILVVIGFPFTILTLGFFRFIINGIILYLLEMFVSKIGLPGMVFEIHGSLAVVVAVLGLTVFNVISSLLLH